MNRNLFITLGVIIVIIVLVIVYPQYFRHNPAPHPMFSTTAEELSQMAIRDRNCEGVIPKATEFLAENPNAEDIWEILATCQFDLAKFTEAKASFEKVLSINPNNIAAQNYLKQLNFGEDQVVVIGPDVAITRDVFETAFGLPTGTTLSFGKAIQKTSNIPKYFVAEYATPKSVSETADFLQKEWQKLGVEASVSSGTNQTILATGNELEVKVITVRKAGEATLVEMNYQKLR